LPASAQPITATVLPDSASCGCPVSDTWAAFQTPSHDPGQYYGQRSRSLPREATAASPCRGAWETTCLALGLVADGLSASPKALSHSASLPEPFAEAAPTEVRWRWPEAVIKDAEPSSRLVAAMPTPLRARRALPPGEPLLTPGTLVSMGLQVRNTFIHADMPPSSPIASSAKRALSCPRSMGSELLVQ
jgi:hypothetical protein